jgi:hypothetical protein
MTDRDATPDPEDDPEDTPPPICARCGAVITGGVIKLRTKVVGRVISTQFRCVRCSEDGGAIPQRP